MPRKSADDATRVTVTTPQQLVIRHPLSYNRGEPCCILFVLAPAFFGGCYLLIRLLASGPQPEFPLPLILGLLALPPLLSLLFLRTRYLFSYTVTSQGVAIEHRNMLKREVNRYPREKILGLWLDINKPKHVRILLHLQTGQLVPIFWDLWENAQETLDKACALLQLPSQVVVVDDITLASAINSVKDTWAAHQHLLTQSQPSLSPLQQRLNVRKALRASDLFNRNESFPVAGQRVVIIAPTQNKLMIQEPGQDSRSYPLDGIADVLIVPTEEGTRQHNGEDADTYLYSYEMYVVFASGERIFLKHALSEESVKTLHSAARDYAERTAAYLRSLR